MEKILVLPNIVALDSNNILDKEILTENIFIIIPDYSSKAVGDEVTFFFGKYMQHSYLLTQDNLNKPIIIEYDPDTIPVDTYQVYYTVTDVQHNTGTSPTLTVRVIDQRTEIPLEAPTLEGETTDGILYLSELANTITMDIPAPQRSLVTGDVIFGFIDDQKSVEHLVFVELDEHKIKFNKDFFSEGDYSIYYTRTRNGTTVSSKKATVKFVTKKTQPTTPNLKAPILPNAINGVIDLTGLTEGVAVLVPAYDAMSGDTLQVSIGDAELDDYIIHSSGYSPTPYIFNYPEKYLSYLPLEKVDVYYYLYRNGNKYQSPIVQVKFTRDLSLKAPELECVENGELNLSHCPNTLTLTVPHYEAAKGDVINAWIGSYQAVPHYVVQDELDVHTLKFTTNKISTGQQDVYYKVKRNSEEYLSPSLKLDVITSSCPKPCDTISRIMKGDSFYLSALYLGCEQSIGTVFNGGIRTLTINHSASTYSDNYFRACGASSGLSCFYSWNAMPTDAIMSDISTVGDYAIIGSNYSGFPAGSLLPAPEAKDNGIIIRGDNGYYLSIDNQSGYLRFNKCRQQATVFNVTFK